jgi:hypothetical protein
VNCESTDDLKVELYFPMTLAALESFLTPARGSKILSFRRSIIPSSTKSHQVSLADTYHCLGLYLFVLPLEGDVGGASFGREIANRGRKSPSAVTRTSPFG